MSVSFFVYLSGAYVLGIFAAATGNLIVLLGAIIILLFKRHFFSFIIALSVLSSAFIYYHHCDQLVTESQLWRREAGDFQGQGVVVEDVDPGGKNQKLIIKLLSPQEYLGEKVLIKTFLYPRFQAGDVLEFNGVLTKPENWSNFRYDRYLARQGIYVLMSYPHVSKIGEQTSWFFSLMKFKKQLYQQIIAALPEPEAGLAAALMLGYRDTITPEAKNIFAQTGLSHLIAISGSHLTLLASLLFLFFSRLKVPLKKGAFIVIIFLWFYVILTGLSASALRSALMATLVLINERKKWKFSSGGILLLSAALMLIHNPLLWRDDLGFQLSFLAMIALIYGQPIGEHYLGKGSLRSTLILTTNAQLLTWPISAYNFGSASIIAPLANLLIAWTFTWLLPLLIANTLFSFVFASSWLWLGTYFLLHFIFITSRILSQIPGASASLNISSQGLWVYYFILFFVGRYLHFRVKKRALQTRTLSDTSLKIT